MIWAHDAYVACVSWSGTPPRIRATLLATIEARSAVNENGIRVATFARKDLIRDDDERRTLHWAQRAGVLMRSRERGRLGTEYRLLTTAESEAETGFCDRCAERHYKTALVAQDVLVAYVASRRWDDEPVLVACPGCAPHCEPTEGCIACPALETPCTLNGRPVCAWCYLACLDPDLLDDWLEGEEAAVDLTPLAVTLETRIGLANIPHA